MTRPSTLDGPATLFDDAARRKLDRAFEEYHAANPAVYSTLRDLALDMRRRGHHRVGVKMLWEVMRWQLTISTTTDPAGFKLNNNLCSRYARLLMDQEPELEGMFNTRELRGT